MQFKTDWKGRIAWVSKDWQEFVELSLRDVEGTQGNAIVHPEDLAYSEREAINALVRGRPVELKLRILAGGRYQEVLAAAVPRWKNGLFRGYDGMIEPVRLFRRNAVVKL